MQSISLLDLRVWQTILGQLFGARQQRRPARPRGWIRLEAEILEDRLAPAQITLGAGESAAMSGDDVLVGAPVANHGQGVVSLFNNLGTLLQTISNPDNGTNDNFGRSVALSDSYVLVGAENTNNYTGAACLYSLSGQLLQTFSDPNSTAGDQFGSSVALSGSNVLIGAFGVNNNAGAAYLFNTSGTLLQTFADPNNAAGDYVGSSVALSGQNVLIGEGPGSVNNPPLGKAYLFDTSGALLQTFTDPNNAPSDNFGSSVALSGNDVLLGAFGADNSSGAAYLYNTTGQFLQSFTDPNITSGDDFGARVALSTNDVLVGAIGTNGTGAAYLFNTSGQLLQTYPDPGNQFGGFFGNSLALSGNDVLVGDFESSEGFGGTYLYTGELSAQSGNGQTTTVATTFGTALEAQTIDASGNFATGQPVTFTETDGPTGTGASFPNGNSVTVGSNLDGLAIAPPLTANTVAGTYTVTASWNGNSVSFVLTNTSDVPASVTAIGGTPQTAVAGSAFGVLLQVLVTDGDGNPVANVPVTFSAPASGPTGTFDAYTTVPTNGLGIATAPSLTANSSAGNYAVTASVSGGAASTEFDLTNTSDAPFAITAIGGAHQNAIVGTMFGSPMQALVTERDGNPAANVAVTFAVLPSSGPTGTFSAYTTVSTNALGVATAPAITANHLVGNFIVTASVSGIAHPADFTLTNTLVPATISVKAGSGQHTTVNTNFATPLQVTVLNAAKQPVTGISVDFEIAPDGASSGTFAAGGAVTDGNGVATAPTLTANKNQGGFTVEAFVAGVATPAIFTLTNIPGAPNAIIIYSGSSQHATVGRPYASALQLFVTDQYGNSISKAVVTFTVNPQSNAGATFPGAKKTATVSTLFNGEATSPTLTANTTAGSFTVTATVNGVATPATFDLTNQPDPPYLAPKGQAQSGAVGQVYDAPLQARVTDKYGNPITGLAVTFTAPITGAGGTFDGEQSATAITNIDGVATAPAFTANTKAGRYVMTLTAHGAPMGQLVLTNLSGPAANVKVIGKTSRAIVIDGVLSNLDVEVADAYGNTIASFPVTFTVQSNPISGAAGTFVGQKTTANTNAAGIALAPPLKANSRRGTFTVSATIPDAAIPAIFDVTIDPAV